MALFRAPQLTPIERDVIRRIEEVRQQLRHNLAAPRRWWGLLARNTLARAIQGSNSIEGYNVTREDAIAAVEGEEPLDPKDEAWLAVVGYRTAMTFVLELAKKDKDFMFNEGIIRSLHFMMLHYDLDKRPGNWRQGTIYVRREPSGEVVYEGPEVERVSGLIEELIESLNDDSKEHVLVRAAMAHLNLVMIHPFSDGNGRMARCLQTLVLAKEGILFPEFCSIEEYLGANPQEYYQALGETGRGSWQPKNSARAWIQFNLTAHYRQAVTLYRRTIAMANLWEEVSQLAKQQGFPDRMLFALCDGAIGIRVRNASYRTLAGVNDILASRDLKNAVDAGLLIPSGERRGRIYVGSPQLRGIFDKIKSMHLGRVPDPFEPDKQMQLPIAQ
jgi:Fic family protein